MVAGSEGVVGGWDSGTLPTSSMLVSILVRSPALVCRRYHGCGCWRDGGVGLLLFWSRFGGDVRLGRGQTSSFGGRGGASELEEGIKVVIRGSFGVSGWLGEL